MKVRFRVISELTGNDLTDKECWLLTPDGRLVYKRGDSLYEDECLKVVFDIDTEEKTGTWLFPKYAGEEYYKCSECGTEYPVPPTWDSYDVKEYLKHCTNCGVKMKEATC